MARGLLNIDFENSIHFVLMYMRLNEKEHFCAMELDSSIEDISTHIWVHCLEIESKVRGQVRVTEAEARRLMKVPKFQHRIYRDFPFSDDDDFSELESDFFEASNEDSFDEYEFQFWDV